MELELDNCGVGVRFTALDTAVGRINGTDARLDGDDAVLFADNEGAVWNVWRELGKMESTAYSDTSSEAAAFVQDAVEGVMGTGNR